jgi:hypothetical protein
VTDDVSQLESGYSLLTCTCASHAQDLALWYLRITVGSSRPCDPVRRVGRNRYGRWRLLPDAFPRSGADFGIYHGKRERAGKSDAHGVGNGIRMFVIL